MIKPTKYVWHDGKFVPWKDANIHVTTWTLHYAVGVFEGMRAYKGKDNTYVVRLKEHIERLAESAKIYQIPLKYSRKKIEDACLELVQKNGLKSAYVRPILYFGEMKRLGLNPGNTPSVLSIFSVDFGHYLGADALEKGVKVATSSWRRDPSSSVPTTAKCCGNYANSYLGKMEALKEGYAEAIMTDFEGYVSEGSAENLFMVNDGKLITPPTSASILRGLTRDCIMEIAENEGIEVVEKNITHGQLFVADELFFTGTAGEVTPIVEVDRRKVANGKRGKMTEKLQSIYFNAVRGADPKYKKWITPVYK